MHDAHFCVNVIQNNITVYALSMSVYLFILSTIQISLHVCILLLTANAVQLRQPKVKKDVQIIMIHSTRREVKGHI